MDYRPRYAQPFTLAEAVGMDVPIITEGSQAYSYSMFTPPIKELL